uniref:Uncharacterized protein n=1 Tax=Phaeomonas parva TaxID=124430 RepID=A0A7S1TPR1_9STRA|mmetsp:Transcript_11447/g.34763  ORF Transcript_11447/g.34763 Transcript_11447/m.34763 type:complete len:198 (+) Transcript_11447:535-1128(+)
MGYKTALAAALALMGAALSDAAQDMNIQAFSSGAKNAYAHFSKTNRKLEIYGYNGQLMNDECACNCGFWTEEFFTAQNIDFGCECDIQMESAGIAYANEEEECLAAQDYAGFSLDECVDAFASSTDNLDSTCMEDPAQAAKCIQSQRFLSMWMGCYANCISPTCGDYASVDEQALTTVCTSEARVVPTKKMCVSDSA